VPACRTVYCDRACTITALLCTYNLLRKGYTVLMTFPQILEYLTHRRSHGPPDNCSSSCFDENQTPVWAYCYKDLAADVRQSICARARGRLQLPPGRNTLHIGQVLANIGLDLEIDGHHVRLEGVELSMIATPALADLSVPLTEPTYSPLPAFVA
jgi:hypothetical protein